MATLTAVNARTLANYVATSNSQQQIWSMHVVLESKGAHPLKFLISGYKGGLPIEEVMDTRKLKGDTIQLTTKAPLGGAGVQGDTERSGTEEKGRHNVYSFTVGMKWHGLAATQLARAQTVAGATFDRDADKMLAEWLAWQQGWDLEMEMRIKAHGRNTIYANGRLSIATLGTADFITGYDVTRANTLASTNQAKPLQNAKAASGAPIKKYVLVASDYALAGWKGQSSWQALVAQAQARGDGNPLFSGGMPDWQNNIIYEYQAEFGTQYGPIGCGSLPVAVLGTAIAANTTAPEIKGGGDTTGAALTTPQYFAAFRSAPYTGFEGSKIAAVTDVRRYWMIWNLTGADAGKFGFYSGLLNDGNKLTSDERLRASASGGAVTTLTGSSITWDVAPWTSAYLTDAHPAGSLVFECNEKGVPLCYSYLMGSRALISGYGSTDKGVAMAEHTEEVQDHGRLIAHGIAAVWGCKAVPRTDAMVNGYVLIVSGFKLPTMPDVA